jgi:hypothetical protein
VSLSDRERSSIIDAVMIRKLGDLSNWMHPKLAHTFGANDIDSVEDFEKRLGEMIQRLNAAFEAMTDDELNEIGDHLSDPMRISESNWGAMDSVALNLLHKNLPPSIAFGFGHPDFSADFTYWGCMPNLTLHELTALSVGADPRKITEKYIEKRLELSKRNRPLWSADTLLVQQREIFARYFHNTGWGFVSEPISRVKMWIDKMSMAVHPEFYSSLAQRLDQPKPHAVSADRAKTLTNQERDTLLKLIAAMSCEQYGYTPDAKRSPVSSNIKDDLERVGLGMDDKTIRKWLKEASRLVNPDYWQGQS